MQVLLKTGRRMALLETRVVGSLVTVPSGLWQYPRAAEESTLPSAVNPEFPQDDCTMNTETPTSIAEAIAIQQEMRRRVLLEDGFGEIRTIAGIDVGYDPKRNISRAALVVLRDGELETSIVAYDTTPFPYVPGLLSFREAPVILKALAGLKELPDILFVDGHGIAHPRRLGIAAHIGVLTGLPAIGIAKKLLCGSYREPGLNKGDRSDLIHRGEKIGTVLRSKERVKPLFVSPGHRVSHDTAVTLVERQLTKYRLPEPTRLADMLSKTK